MRIFISYSYSHKVEFAFLHKEISDSLTKGFNIEVYSFVFDFKEEIDDKALMKHALLEIDRSDAVVVELSYKSVGIGIEAGYAKAKGKPLIYLVKEGQPKAQTMNGIADYVVEYSNSSDVIKWFKQYRPSIK